MEKKARESQNEMILKALEHIINVTNIGLRLKEVGEDIVLTYPIPISPDLINENSPGEYLKAELIFSREAGNDLVIRHRFPGYDSPKNGELISSISAGSLQERNIYESVIHFLKRVKNR